MNWALKANNVAPVRACVRLCARACSVGRPGACRPGRTGGGKAYETSFPVQKAVFPSRERRGNDAGKKPPLLPPCPAPVLGPGADKSRSDLVDYTSLVWYVRQGGACFCM